MFNLKSKPKIVRKEEMHLNGDYLIEFESLKRHHFINIEIR